MSGNTRNPGDESSWSGPLKCRAPFVGRRQLERSFGPQASAGKIYRRGVTSGTDTDVDRCVRQIAAGLHQRLGELTAVIQRLLQDEIPELALDAQSIELLGASVGGNVDTVLHAMRYGIDVQRVEAPTAAMEYARRLAQHGVPVHGLVRGYRVGQRRMNELVFAEVQATDMEPMVRVAVLEKMSAIMFAYIDWMSQQVVEVYEEERERWLENQNSLRALRVREILAAKTPVDVDAASTTIRYPLRWHHLAVVAWFPDAGSDGNELPRLQRFLRDIGQAAGVAASPTVRGRQRRVRLGMATLPRRRTRSSRQSPPVRGHPCGLAQCGNRLDGGGCRRIPTVASQGAGRAGGGGRARAATNRLWSPRTIPVCWWPPCLAGTSPRPVSGWPKCSATWPSTTRTMPGCARRCSS